MSEAPERIYAAPPSDDREWKSGAGEWDASRYWTADGATEYVRADRIEELEAKLARAVEALAWCSSYEESEVARTALAELKGEK